MEIGEIAVRAWRSFDRPNIRSQLDQITGNEARGEAKVAEHLHQQPAGITAGAGTNRQRFFAALNTGVESDHISDFLLHPPVQIYQKVNGAPFLPANGSDEHFQQWTGWQRLPVG